MATFTLYEYANVGLGGGPIQPPTKRTTGAAFGAAVRLEVGTEYIEAIPDVSAHVRVSEDGAAATTDDILISAGGYFYSEVTSTSDDPAYVYIIAA